MFGIAQTTLTGLLLTLLPSLALLSLLLGARPVSLSGRR